MPAGEDPPKNKKPPSASAATVPAPMKSVVFFVSAGAGSGNGLSGDELIPGADMPFGADMGLRLDMGPEGGSVGAAEGPGAGEGAPKVPDAGRPPVPSRVRPGGIVGTPGRGAVDVRVCAAEKAAALALAALGAGAKGDCRSTGREEAFCKRAWADSSWDRSNTVVFSSSSSQSPPVMGAAPSGCERGMPLESG